MASGEPRLVRKVRWREVAESYPCADCGAGPGSPCRTRNQTRAQTPHTVRTNLASDNNWRFPEENYR